MPAAAATHLAPSQKEKENGQMLRVWRRMLGITLEDLSARSRINLARLSLHENGIQALKPERQELVARILLAEMAKRLREINTILGSVPDGRSAAGA